MSNSTLERHQRILDTVHVELNATIKSVQENKKEIEALTKQRIYLEEELKPLTSESKKLFKEVAALKKEIADLQEEKTLYLKANSISNKRLRNRELLVAEREEQAKTVEREQGKTATSLQKRETILMKEKEKITNKKKSLAKAFEKLS